jgi:ribose/xylose/arabinose/galactoside ABC-type transport system permease subunit
MEKSSALTSVQRIVRNKSFGLFVILVAVFIVFSLINHTYYALSNITTILYSAAIGGILMIGFAALLISGNADMSFAAVGSLASISCCMMITRGVPWVLAVILAVLMGAACGVINAITWYKFHIMPFIGTMGISYIWSGLAAYITKNKPVLVDSQGFFKIGSPLIFGVIPISFAYVVILIIAYGILLSSTKFGRKVYMCGGNMFAARLSGVNITKVGTIMMINCSAVSAFGGIVLASRMHQITVESLSMMLMNSMTGAFLGGVSFGGGSGGMFGAFMGLLLLNFFNNGLIMVGVGTYWQLFAQGMLLIVALFVDGISTRARMKALKVK